MNTNSRRSFLQGSLTTSAAMATAPVLGGVSTEASSGSWGQSGQTAARAPDGQANRISVLSYSFQGLFTAGKIDTFGYLETCRYRYNLDAANIWNRFLTSMQEDYIRKVRDALDERGLVLAVLTCDGCHIWDQDPDVRKKNKAIAVANLNAAKTLGAQFVRIDAGGARDGKDWSNEALDGIVTQYQEYARFAADNGFKMGPENHWGPEHIWPNMQKLYKAMNNHPGFGLSVHMSAWQGKQEEKDLADKESAPRVVAVHFDNDTCNGPLVEKMSLLRNAGYKGYWVVENHSGGQNEYAATAVQVAQVRAVLQSWRVGGTGALPPGGPGSRPPGRANP